MLQKQHAEGFLVHCRVYFVFLTCGEEVQHSSRASCIRHSGHGLCLRCLLLLASQHRQPMTRSGKCLGCVVGLRFGWSGLIGIALRHRSPNMSDCSATTITPSARPLAASLTELARRSSLHRLLLPTSAGPSRTEPPTFDHMPHCFLI